jgi:sec-independent protein translocase protein TatA
MPFRVGPWELALILGIVLIIFGAGKLPQIGGAIGKSVKEFRKGRSDESSENQPAVAATAAEATTSEAAKEETK